MPEIRMDRLSWPDYQRRVQQDGAAVFLPLGATEQHGPHMAMGTDQVLPTAIAAEVAQRLGGLLAPTLAYGYKSQPKSGGGNHYVGTTSVSGTTLIGLVRDILCELARHGVKRIVVLNGHMENTMFAVEGIDLALRDLRADGIADVKILKVEYYEFLSGEVLDKVFDGDFRTWALEHAATFETSLMLHFAPDLVDLSRLPNDAPADFPPYDVYPTVVDWVPPSGVLSPAHGASAEKGRWIAEDIITRMTATLAPALV
ncbi:creatininase [Zavarzinia sp. CC-PAN008]|uniref:creatininase n=1 Tax=Zavarzinia sp. CC-PAN008 TaxID=3243332 RepID=UPI003F74682B